MKVKICGQTSLGDCNMAMKHGADFVGVVVDVEWSPRSLDINRATPIFDNHKDHCFLLTYNMNLKPELKDCMVALKPYALQLTGQESTSDVEQIKSKMDVLVYKSIHLNAQGNNNENPNTILARMEEFILAGVDGFVLDTASRGMFGGTGVKSDWDLAGLIIEKCQVPLFLAGGINSSNVAEAIGMPGLYGIDLASGVEDKKGEKSEAKVRTFFDVVRGITITRP